MTERAPVQEPSSRWIYHLVTPSRWALGDDPYTPDSIAHEGYIHGSFRSELRESARLYFAPESAPIVLQLDPAVLAAHGIEIVYADTPRGPMPHLHAPLPRAAVHRTLTLDESDQSDDTRSALDTLLAKVHAFNLARDWQQFHSPKNLAMALTIEASELAEPYRWDTDAQAWERALSEAGRAHLQDEMADILLLLLSLADYNKLDLLGATEGKLARNESRYPAAQSRGRADKYTAYQARKPDEP
ncbi:MAG: DUF952 domain-containing protein [Deltaproteobacteria bacterium]|nr:DUF952 domain-containing protein [Deltaproteobacteria bacterium]